MRYFFALVFIFILQINCCAQVITGGVEYNTQNAREELLNCEKKTIPILLFRQNIVDFNKTQNSMLLLKGNTDLIDRTLAKFSDGSYGIIFKDNPLYVWYYGKNGVLTHSEVKTGLDYPYKTYKYSLDNKLVNMSLRVSEDETFIYTPDGKLIAHWIGANCYDENNTIIMTREIYSEKIK